jgi:L-alanine-DL-glutamate epimerase-like enolase superfamily enzyme
VIPHGHSLHAALRLIASAPAPVKARLTVPDAPGFGIELDDAKIEARTQLHWP